jgi:hypothetical protein
MRRKQKDTVSNKSVCILVSYASRSGLSRSWSLLARLCWKKKETSLVFFSHGVRLSPLATAATVWPTVPAPDDIWWWLWSNRWNANWQGKLKYSDKTCPTVTLSTTNPTWSDPGSNPSRHDGKSASNLKVWHDVTTYIHLSGILSKYSRMFYKSSTQSLTAESSTDGYKRSVPTPAGCNKRRRKQWCQLFSTRFFKNLFSCWRNSSSHTFQSKVILDRQNISFGPI